MCSKFAVFFPSQTTKVQKKTFQKQQTEETLTLRLYLMTLPNDRGLLWLSHYREGGEQQEGEEKEEAG